MGEEGAPVTARRMAWCTIFLTAVIVAGAATAEEDPDAPKWREQCPGFSEWEKQRQPDPAAQSPLTTARNTKLKARILRMRDEDQQARAAMTGDMAKLTRAQISKINAIDRRNLKTIKVILTQYGTPTPDSISEDGVGAFWILVQHADSDPALQERVLHDFQDHPSGVRRQDIALLIDRVRVNQHRPQVYGSQFHSVGKVFAAHEIEDPENVDERRKAMNLPSMALYKCMLHVAYEGAVIE